MGRLPTVCAFVAEDAQRPRAKVHFNAQGTIAVPRSPFASHVSRCAITLPGRSVPGGSAHLSCPDTRHADGKGQAVFE